MFHASQGSLLEDVHQTGKPLFDAALVATFLTCPSLPVTAWEQRQHRYHNRNSCEQEKADLGVVDMLSVIETVGRYHDGRKESDDYDHKHWPKAAGAGDPSANPTARTKPADPRCHDRILVRPDETALRPPNVAVHAPASSSDIPAHSPRRALRTIPTKAGQLQDLTSASRVPPTTASTCLIC